MTTLFQRFWTHVFERPEAPAVMLKDPSGEIRNLSMKQAGCAVATIMVELSRRGIKEGDRVAILGWNSPEWVFADMAIQTMGAVAVAIYPNDSAEKVNYIIKNSGAVLTLSNDHEQLKKIDGGATLHFERIPPSVAGLRKNRSFMHRLQEGSLEESQVVARQISAVREHLSKIKDGDYDKKLATLIYTSGSTGTPKGCKISHGNISGALKSLIEFGITQDPEKDRYLSYLPLAHVYERVNGMGMCIWNGVPVAFSPIDEMAANVRVFRPTMLAGVPAVWQKIRDGIYNPKEGLPKILNKIWLWAPLLNWAFSKDKTSAAFRFADKHIFSKIRAKFGGELKLLVSGGAPITPELLHFFNQLGFELLEGYGATETTGGITTNQPSWVPGNGPKNKVGSVGRVVPGAEIRLVPQEGDENSGTGEIYLRGPQVFQGYWELPEATAGALSTDGWYRTGDLGKIDSDGFIYIVGRADGMYKTLGGKYVPREKVEKAFQASPIVHYTVPVAHGRKYCTALIFVNHAVARSLLTSGVPAGSDAGAFLASAPEVQKAVAEAVAGANAKLEQWEQVKRFKIMPMEATIEAGIITPTLKIRSKELIKRFAAEIDEIYNSAN